MTEKSLTVQTPADVIESVVISGDLSKLTPEQRVSYYQAVCKSLGLNPLTRPFDYITLNSKLTLYAKKDATDQLRRLHGVSIDDVDIRETDAQFIVKVKGHNKDGRSDVEVGVVNKNDMRGDPANAQMKAVTKGKRRLTLSLVGLGWLDETEIETIPDAAPVAVDDAGEIVPSQKHDRPYPPDVLRSKITDKAMSLQGRSCSDKQRNLAVGMLSECFAGDEHHEQKRHTVTDFLFGVDSMTKLHDNEVLALLEWLKPTQDSGGAYAPDPRSAKEAQAVVTAAMKAAGQGELI